LERTWISGTLFVLPHVSFTQDPPPLSHADSSRFFLSMAAIFCLCLLVRINTLALRFFFSEPFRQGLSVPPIPFHWPTPYYSNPLTSAFSQSPSKTDDKTTFQLFIPPFLAATSDFSEPHSAVTGLVILSRTTFFCFFQQSTPPDCLIVWPSFHLWGRANRFACGHVFLS